MHCHIIVWRILYLNCKVFYSKNVLVKGLLVKMFWHWTNEGSKKVFLFIYLFISEPFWVITRTFQCQLKYTLFYLCRTFE